MFLCITRAEIMDSVHMLYMALFTHIQCLSRRKGAIQKGRSQLLYGWQ